MLSVPMHGGYTVYFSDEDSDFLSSTWMVDKHKLRRVVYAWRHMGPRKIRWRESMHRVILTRVLGRELLRSEKVDHIDGDGLNNVRSNLRLSTHAQNKCNAPKPRNAKASSKYKGVSWNSRDRMWRVFISINQKSIYIGQSYSELEAGHIYDAAAIKYYKEFAFLNFPDSQGVRLVKKVTGQV